MKKNINWFRLLVILIIFGNKIQAQGNNKFLVSADFYHSWAIVDEKFILDEPGFYKPLFNPGMEILYFNKLIKNGNWGAGLFYQRSRFGARHVGLGRFRIQELSLPIVYKGHISIGKKNFILTSGIYNGLLIKCTTDLRGSAVWLETNKKYFYNYSGDIFFSDLYIDVGCPIHGDLGNFNLSPYFKYRLNGTWVNFYDRNIYLGIKFSYLFKHK